MQEYGLDYQNENEDTAILIHPQKKKRYLWNRVIIVVYRYEGYVLDILKCGCFHHLCIKRDLLRSGNIGRWKRRETSRHCIVAETISCSQTSKLIYWQALSTISQPGHVYFEYSCKTSKRRCIGESGIAYLFCRLFGKNKTIAVSHKC